MTVVAAFFAGVNWQQFNSDDDRTTTAIAMAGSFDLTGNGIDDSDKVRMLIRRNNGRVVAVEDSIAGTIGLLDRNTKYLVVGGMSNLDRDKSQLIHDARTNGVPIISVEQFLLRHGVQGTPRLNRTHDGFATQ